MAEKRISGRIGSELDLNVTFFKNGTPTPPYAIRRIDIFKSSIKDENKVAEIVIPYPDDSSYPSPIIAGDANSDGIINSGEFIYRWEVPLDLTPDLYFDVWYFIPIEPTPATGSSIDFDDTTLWQKCCNKFWLYEGGFFCWDGLEVPNFGFTPLSMKFRKPEKRFFEVGVMPLPLYDFDQNLLYPMLLKSTATITIETPNCEVLVTNAPMTMGVRSGSYRTDPFVLRYEIDTADFLISTLKARVTLNLPTGQSIVSPDMYLEIH